MPQHAASPRPLCRPAACARASLGAALSLGFLVPVLRAGEIVRQNFDIPAGDAAATLRSFSTQAGEQMLYSPDEVRGVQTRAVRGELTPIAALERMLQGTPLKARQDAQTRAIAITAPKRPPPPPRDDRRLPDSTTRRPTTPDSTMKKSLPARLLAALAAMSAAAVPAQNSATPAPTTRSNDATVVLSPFEVNVSADQGWIANGTLLANRLNQPLKDVPVTIDALTKDFMHDVGAFNDFEAAKWVANVHVSDENTRSDFGRYTFRGIGNQWGTNRNFFRWYVPNDGYNLSRIDFGRGSNSLIFGDNEPGGQATVYTKRALLGRTFTSVLAQTGSFDAYRIELDHNRQLTKSVALRLNAVNSDEDRVIDWNRFAFRGYHGTITWRPARNTLARAEAEVGRHDRVWGTNIHFIKENPAPGLSFGRRLVVLRNGTLIDNTRMANGDVLPDGNVWNATRDRAGGSGADFILLDRDTRQVGAFAFRGFSRETNWGGPDMLDNRHYTTFSVYLEHRFSRSLVAELAFNQQKQWNERNNFANADFTGVDFLGRRFTNTSWREYRGQNKVQTPRLMLAYNLDRFSWMQQSFVATAEYRRDSMGEGNRQLRWAGAPGVTPTTNLSDANLYEPVFRYYQDIDPYPPTRAQVFANAPAGTRPFQNWAYGQQHTARAFALSSSGTYLGGRVQTLLGLRYDTNDTADNGAWIAANKGAQGDFVWSGSKRERPERWVYSPLFHFRETTHNLGLVYMVNKAVNLYVMNSSSYRFDGKFNFLNQGLGPILGETTEAGFKAALLDNKLQWNVTWYDLNRENVLAFFNRNGVTDVQLQNAINGGIDPTSPNYLVIRPGASNDTRTQLSRGWETTFQFFPAKGLNVRVSGALTKVKQANSFPTIRAALAAADARQVSDPAIATTIARLRDGLESSGADGARLVGEGAAPFSLNYAVDYRFAGDTRWRGLSVGVNGFYTGDFTLGYFGAFPGATRIEGGRSFTLNGTLGWQRRIFERPVSFRLHVYNIVAPEYREVGGLIRYNNGTAYAKALNYGPPTTFRLTVSTDL